MFSIIFHVDLCGKSKCFPVMNRIDVLTKVKIVPVCSMNGGK